MNPNPDSQKSPKKFDLTSDNAFAVYTMLSIIKKMRQDLGLEAMLEYMDFYREEIEKASPGLKNAVAKALNLVSVAKIYNEATQYEKN